MPLRLLFFAALLAPCAARAAVVNPGFETGTTAGWTQGFGSGPFQMVSVVGPGPAPFTNGNLDRVRQGSFACELYSGSAVLNHAAFASVSQQATVDAASPYLEFYFASVLTGVHAAEITTDAYTQVDVFTATATAFTRRFQYASSPLPLEDDGVPFYRHLPWTQVVVDLGAYVGATVTVRFHAHNCAYGDHESIGYVDGLALLPSLTPTPTFSDSPTESATLTASASRTPSPSATASVSPTGTLTRTGTRSATPTISATRSPSGTMTPSLSPAATLTPTPPDSRTPSPAATSTRSVTASPSDCPTVSPSPSPSGTPTPSLSLTHSPGVTATATPTASPGFSASPSASPTPPASSTPSATASRTPSATATLSPTALDSRTASPSGTMTPTPSASPTPPPCPTASPSTSPTPAALRLRLLPPSPNPSSGPGTWLPFFITAPAELRVRVFTVAGESVRDLDPFSAPAGFGEAFWNHRNSNGERVGSGVFIVRVQARSPGGEEDRGFSKCAVIR